LRVLQAEEGFGQIPFREIGIPERQSHTYNGRGNVRTTYGRIGC
jgi:hypothetical protein